MRARAALHHSTVRSRRRWTGGTVAGVHGAPNVASARAGSPTIEHPTAAVSAAMERMRSTRHPPPRPSPSSPPLVLAACSGDDDEATTTTTATSVAPATGRPATGAVDARSPPTARHRPWSRPNPSCRRSTTPTQLGGSQLYVGRPGHRRGDPARSHRRPGGRRARAGVRPRRRVDAVYALTDAPELVTFDVADPVDARGHRADHRRGRRARRCWPSTSTRPTGRVLRAQRRRRPLRRSIRRRAWRRRSGPGSARRSPTPASASTSTRRPALVRVDVATGEHLLVVPATGAVDADGESAVGQPLAFDPGDVNAGDRRRASWPSRSRPTASCTASTPPPAASCARTRPTTAC